MVDFPVDVIIEIFSRLPVTSLLRFRSISKSCQSLIDSHYFKTLHLNKFHKSKSNLILSDISKLYALDFPTLSTAVNLNQRFLQNRITIIGSCNGLLCIQNTFNQIAIWNPSLRKHWILPYNRTFCPPIVGFGFGFDPLTGDYKLLRISYFPGVGSTLKSEVSLFGCRTNEWKTLPCMPYALYWNETIGVFVDHALHWVVVMGNHRRADPHLIVAFDLRFEVFNEVSLPELGEGFKVGLSSLGGCLSIVVNYQSIRNDIWVMKQYGCKDSWFKLFTLVESLELGLVHFVKPLGYCIDDMKVLFKEYIISNKLFWYNLKSKQVSHATIPGKPNFLDANIWVESLVQPPFPNENYRKKKKLQKSKQARKRA